MGMSTPVHELPLPPLLLLRHNNWRCKPEEGNTGGLTGALSPSTGPECAAANCSLRKMGEGLAVLHEGHLVTRWIFVRFNLKSDYLYFIYLKIYFPCVCAYTILPDEGALIVICLSNMTRHGVGSSPSF